MPHGANIHSRFTVRRFGLCWYMAIQRLTKQRGLGIFLGALLLTIGGASDSHAQDAVENTPPELRDFRLDPPPPENAPEPEATQPITPPATQPTVEPTPAPIVRQPRPIVAEPQPTAPAPTADIPPDTETAPEVETAPPVALPTPGAAPTSTATLPQTDAPALAQPEGIETWVIVAVAGLLLAITGGAFFMWRRRRVAPPSRPRQTNMATSPPTPGPARPRVPPVLPTPKPSPVRAVSMTFAPENAVVSFSSLTIKGQLHITNAGEAPAEGLALSAVLISASNEQQHAIDHFFANLGPTAATSLGSVRPGENMSLPLQLGVALNEMQTFSLQNKTLFAPILVAKLVRSSPDGNAQEVARLVCMIGRESSPPQPKMGPLRLDQGPRSFDRLGQRALLS